MTTAIILTVMTAATPLIFAALGELVAEKSGVLNLGVEGMMLMGAVVAFAVTATTGQAGFAVVAGAAAGTLMALGFGLLTLTLMANQVACGLALTLFGIGLSALLGNPFVGTPVPGLPTLDVPALTGLPVVGPVLFAHDALVYLGLALVPLTALFLNRTRWGLILRAVGENHEAAHAIGHPVIAIRYAAVAFGGAMAGVGGAYLSIAYTPMWVEEMTAGRGWIALALVVFAAWRPWRLLLGAYLFGGVSILQLHAQGGALFDVPSQVFSMLPYIATIVILTILSSRTGRRHLAAPACLGKPFHSFG